SQCAHGRLAPRTGPLDAHFNGLQAKLIARRSRSVHRGLLRRVGRAFARAFETDRTRRGPAQYAAIGIAERDDGVVERRLDVRYALRHDALLTLLAKFLLALGRLAGCCRRCRAILLLRFLGHESSSPSFLNQSYLRAATFFFAATAPLRGPLRVRAFVCVRWPRTGRLRRWRKPR